MTDIIAEEKHLTAHDYYVKPSQYGLEETKSATDASCQELEETKPTADASCQEQKEDTFQAEVIYLHASIIGMIHLSAVVGLFYVPYAHFYTFVWAVYTTYLCLLGITVGAHRLFTHRCFKATAPLRIFLVTCQTMAGQKSVFSWVRNHRQHHKYSDTHADPHNSKRGFMFSHIGWLVMTRHPEAIAKGRTIDMSDMQADPYVMFQKRHYVILYVLLNMIFPVAVPCYYWGETLLNSFLIAGTLRYVIALNSIFLINSAAHMFGMRPYDKNMSPTNFRLCSYLLGGEGWHNFHHAFPWDYRSDEFGFRFINYNQFFVEVCEKLGLAYNLRTVSMNGVKKRVLKSGDGSHPVWGAGDIEHEETNGFVDAADKNTEGY